MQNLFLVVTMVGHLSREFKSGEEVLEEAKSQEELWKNRRICFVGGKLMYFPSSY